MRDPDQPTRYRDLYNVVHVDEKWFFMTKDGRSYIICHGEEPPHRSVNHKGYIKKVMFLCATARPRRINGEWWDGKLGIWPIGWVDKAKRRGKYVKKGDPIWRNTSIDQKVYRDLLLDYVVPAILSLFPKTHLEREEGIIIQQDGAK